MKFEQLLQIYWSKHFLYGGKTRSFNITFEQLINDFEGFSNLSYLLFLKRFEFTFYKKKKNVLMSSFSNEQKKIFNMYFSQIHPINNNVFELMKFNLIKLYLIQSFRGKSQAIGKPSRGQRTWSNAWTSYKYNKTIRLFINESKKNIITPQKEESKNKKLIKKKIKVQKKSTKEKKIKKINIWF